MRKRAIKIKKGKTSPQSNPGRITYPNGTYIAPTMPSSAPSGALGASAGLNPPTPPGTGTPPPEGGLIPPPVSQGLQPPGATIGGKVSGGVKAKPVTNQLMPRGYYPPGYVPLSTQFIGAPVTDPTDYLGRIGMGTNPTSVQYSGVQFSPKMTATEVVSSVLSGGKMPNNLMPDTRAALLNDPYTSPELKNAIIADYTFDSVTNQYIMTDEALKSVTKKWDPRANSFWVGGASKGSWLTFRTEQAYESWKRRNKLNAREEEDKAGGGGAGIGSGFDYRGATG